MTLRSRSLLPLLLASSTVATAAGFDAAVLDDFDRFRYVGTSSANRAPDPDPGGWRLVWSDEFNEPKGQPPDPAHWTHEVGDGTASGIPGWGNNELESYTDRLDNA